MKTNIIYNEDCISEKGMCILPDKSIDMILCDLPYGTTACKWDTIIPLKPMWKQYKRIIKDNGAIVLTASQPFTSMLVMSNLKMFKYEWIWEKNKSSNFLQSNYQPRKIHENIDIFSKGYASYTPNKGNMKYIPQMWGVSSAVNKGQFAETALQSWSGRQRDDYKIQSKNKTGKRFPASIQKFKNDTSKLHPTQKPVALFEYLIKTYTNEGDIVLDNCIGSGTTAVACVHLKRHYIGFDTSKKYCDIAKARLEAEKTLWDMKSE